MIAETSPRTRSLLGLATIVSVGFALRAININDQPLWGDEGLTLMIAQWPFSTLFLIPNDPTPGLYYALHKLLIGPHAGVVAARSISLVAGTVVIAATFTWARACQIPGLPAGALTALCFALVDYSQEARSYSLLVLFIALSGWAFVRWRRGEPRCALLLFGACLLFSFYTHFVAVFWIGPMIIAAFLVTRGDPIERRKLEWMLCILAVLAVPEANRLARYPTANFSWLGQAGPVEALNITSYVLLPFGYFDNDRWHLGSKLAAVAGLLCFSLLALIAFRHRAKLIDWARQNQAGAMSLLVSIALPPAIWLFGYLVQPIFTPRTILFAAPGFFILVSLLLSFEPLLSRRAVLVIYSVNLILTGTGRAKEDWRSVTNLLAANVREGDVILLCPSWKVFALRHALREPLDAPLLLVLNGRIMQIEAALGRDPHWVNSYFIALTQKQGFDEGRRAMSRSKRTWRITSGCGPN